MRVLRRRTRTQVRRNPLGAEHVAVLERRRAVATRLVGPSTAAAARVAAAPDAYLLVHGAADIARHCQLLDTPLGSGEIRVVSTPGCDAGEWHLEIGTRDRPGLLASLTGVMLDAGHDIVQAVIANWDDSTALDAFIVRADTEPDPESLRAAIAAAFKTPLSSAPVDDAVVSFAAGPSAGYTHCAVTAADQPGLLHAIATAVTVAGADIHAASVATIGGRAHDRLDLTDPSGRRLDERLHTAIRRTLATGVL